MDVKTLLIGIALVAYLPVIIAPVIWLLDEYPAATLTVAVIGAVHFLF